MKLIAETPHENRILNGLSALLCDLGVDVDSYLHEEALAVTFISSNHFPVPDEMQTMNHDERLLFLRGIEDSIRSAMFAAGYRMMHDAWEKANLGISHPDRHIR